MLSVSSNAADSIRGEDRSPAPSQRRPGGVRTQLAYGFGTIAFGVKDGGFSTLLLVFYSQVLGVRADLVGLAIMLALFVDGLVDPLIGRLSDRTRSRWGRRHPWMYGAILPVGVTYYLLWNPPASLDHDALFAYLLVLAILVRVAIALYEIPSASLAADLTTDYDQRTSLVAFRFFFAFVGAIGMGIAAFSVFLRAQPGGGVLGRAGYGDYALAAAIVMMLSILISAIGTHRHIAGFHTPPTRARRHWRLEFAEAREALSNPSFLAMLSAGLLSAMVTGLVGALTVYFATFFWGLGGNQISLLVLCTLFSAIIALILSPILSRRFEKRNLAVTLASSGLVLAPLAIVLRLLGWFPDNGSPALLPTLLVLTILSGTVPIMVGIVGTSMTIDAIEDNELKTGQRTEGLYFAAAFFTQKFTSGFGIFGAGLMLSLVQFPAAAKPGEVDPDVIRHLALVYLPVVVGLTALSILCLRRYRITRAGHARNLAALGERRADQARK